MEFQLFRVFRSAFRANSRGETREEQQTLEIMDLEGARKMLKIESPTNSGLEVDLKCVQPHHDRRGITACLQESETVLQSISPCQIQVCKQGPEFGVVLILRHYTNSARFRCQSVARSKTRAVRNSFSSAKGAASSWRPIGRFAFVSPQGMLMPGMPARFAVIV